MKPILYVLIVISILFYSCDNGANYFEIRGYAQGGTYSVKFNNLTNDGQILDATTLNKDVDSLLLAIDNSLSGYNKLSLLSRFNNGETIVPDDIFIDIYKKAYSFFELTHGSVDVAAAPLFDLWGFGFTEDKSPTDDAIKACLGNCGLNKLKKNIEDNIDPAGQCHPRTLLKNPSDSLPKLNYNAVAQGYACDVIAKYLDEKNVVDYLIFVGGEIFSKGLNPQREQWTIAIDSPKDGNMTPGDDIEKVFSSPIEGTGVVTSGNYRKYYIKDGQKFAHTIDPRTGYPVKHNLLSATIIADNATIADALATYCMVIGLDEAKTFLNKNPEYQAFLIYDEAGEFKIWSSPEL